MRPLPLPSAEGPLLPWLLAVLAPMNRTRVKLLLRHGSVHVNGVPVTRHDHPLCPGDRVTLERETAATGLPILFENAGVLAIDKPAGLLTVATDAEKTATAFVKLNEARGPVFVVHRLDRETSGVLLFAKAASVRDALQAGWDDVAKTYLAVVEGVPRRAEGVVENHLAEGTNLRMRVVPAGEGAQRAASRYRVRRSRNGLSLVEVELLTGRKHQIRVHMAGLGCPVIGDNAYGARSNPAARLGLHAWRVAFADAGSRVEVESAFPAALAKLV